jgi:hypothetical protein
MIKKVSGVAVDSYYRTNRRQVFVRKAINGLWLEAGAQGGKCGGPGANSHDGQSWHMPDANGQATNRQPLPSLSL